MHSVCTMSKTISPAQAATLAKVSRWTVLRAVKIGEIKAHRDNRNHWQISASSLDEWCKKRALHSEGAHVVAHPDAQANQEEIIRVAKLETENHFLKEQIVELKQDRDAWRDQAQRPARSFWRALTGKK